MQVDADGQADAPAPGPPRTGRMEPGTHRHRPSPL